MSYLLGLNVHVMHGCTGMYMYNINLLHNNNTVREHCSLNDATRTDRRLAQTMRSFKHRMHVDRVSLLTWR